MTALDPRLLEAFLAVADEQHFGRAAARLFLSQPALTRRIQRLESELDVQLVDRGVRRVTLTAGGLALRDEARELLAANARAVERVRRVDGRARTLVVGFLGNAALELTPLMLDAFRRRGAGRDDVVLREAGFDDPTVGLRAGLVDIGFVRPPLDRSGLVLAPLIFEPRVLRLRRDHRLRLAETVPAERLGDLPMIADPPTDARKSSWSIGLAPGVGGRAATLVATSATQKAAAILAGHGVGLVPLSATRWWPHEDLVHLPVRGVEGSPVALAWRNDRHHPLIEPFVAAARDVVRSAAHPPGVHALC